MTAFIWVDQDGREHRLESCAPIQAELAQVERSLLAYADDLESTNEDRCNAALTATEPLVLRRNTLLADLRRWNDHVSSAHTLAASTVIAAIDQLAADASLIRRLQTYYAGHPEPVLANAETAPREEALSPELLALINDVAARHVLRVPPVVTAADVDAWLRAQPVSNRTPLAPAHPAFGWRDRHGHTVQVRSLAVLEREQLELVDELVALRPTVVAADDARARAIALEEARLTLARLSILQGDLERWTVHVDRIRRQGARDRATEIRKFKQ